MGEIELYDRRFDWLVASILAIPLIWLFYGFEAAFVSGLAFILVGALKPISHRLGPDEAPDLVQEIFARFLRSGGPGRAHNPAAYLSRIARNLLIDRARRKRQGTPIFFPFEDDRDASVRPEQTWRIEAADLFRLYRHTVRAMPPKTRRVFVLRRVKRMSCKEIAARLDISLATVDYHMVQALARCRAAVAAQC